MKAAASISGLVFSTLLLGIHPPAQAATVTFKGSTGKWSDFTQPDKPKCGVIDRNIILTQLPPAPGGFTPNCDMSLVTVNDTVSGAGSQIRWGDPIAPGAKQSILTFEGNTKEILLETEKDFLLGILQYENTQVSSESDTGLPFSALLREAALTIDLSLEGSGIKGGATRSSFSFPLGIELTKNRNSKGELLTTVEHSTDWELDKTCAYKGKNACPDLLFLPKPIPEQAELIGDRYFTLGVSKLSSPGLAESIAEFGFPALAVDEESSSGPLTIFVTGKLTNVAGPSTPPTLTGLNIASIPEGQNASASLTATDPNPGNLDFLLNDNLAVTDTSGDPGTRKVNVDLGFFKNNGSFNYTAQVRDSDGLKSNTSLATLTVYNVAPEITFLTEDLKVKPGELFKFFAEAFDPGVDDILSFDWDLNGDGLFDDLLNQKFGEFSFANEGLFSIGLQVSDNDGGKSVPRYFNVNVTSVPEPSSIVGLLSLGLVGCLGSRVTRKSHRRLSRSEK